MATAFGSKSPYRWSKPCVSPNPKQNPYYSDALTAVDSSQGHRTFDRTLSQLRLLFIATINGRIKRGSKTRILVASIRRRWAILGAAVGPLVCVDPLTTYLETQFDRKRCRQQRILEKPTVFHGHGPNCKVPKSSKGQK